MNLKLCIFEIYKPPSAHMYVETGETWSRIVIADSGLQLQYLREIKNISKNILFL